MNFIEMRNGLRENLLTVCDNVVEVFTHPEDYTSLNQDFPYITMVFGEGEINSRRQEQRVSIIGFVKGENKDIPDMIIELKNKVYNALYKKDPKIVIETQDLTNLFKPFGLDVGIFPPYGGFRFEGIVPGIIEPI